MQLSDAERLELAAFFAKRLTPAGKPRTPGTPADIEGWTSALRAPSAARTVRRAAEALPDDANLQAVASEFLRSHGPDRVLVASALVGASAAFLITIVIGVAVLGQAPLLDDAVAQTPAPVGIEVASEAGEADEAPAPDEAEVAAAPATKDAPRAEDAAEAPAVAAVEGGAADETPARAAAAQGPRCAGSPGSVVGYWHAGEVAPGQAGAVLEMPHGRNVRADYPDVHNRFDRRSAVQCQLHRGDRVRLSRDPILVPGGHYWVPLVAGDLIGGQS